MEPRSLRAEAAKPALFTDHPQCRLRRRRPVLPRRRPPFNPRRTIEPTLLASYSALWERQIIRPVHPKRQRPNQVLRRRRRETRRHARWTLSVKKMFASLLKKARRFILDRALLSLHPPATWAGQAKFLFWSVEPSPPHPS